MDRAANESEFRFDDFESVSSHDALSETAEMDKEQELDKMIDVLQINGNQAWLNLKLTLQI